MKINIIEVLDANIAALRERFASVDNMSCSGKDPCGHTLSELEDIHSQCNRQAVLVEELLPKFRQEDYLKELDELAAAVSDKHREDLEELRKKGPPENLLKMLKDIFGPPMPMGPGGDA